MTAVITAASIASILVGLLWLYDEIKNAPTMDDR